jgi:hypothetical protein
MSQPARGRRRAEEGPALSWGCAPDSLSRSVVRAGARKAASKPVCTGHYAADAPWITPSHVYKGRGTI